MKRFWMMTVAVAALLALVMPASAQTPKGGKGGEGKAGAGVQAREKTFDFDGDVVEAQFLRPDQGVAEVVRLDEGPSLIKVRTDFADEILKSAEDL